MSHGPSQPSQSSNGKVAAVVALGLALGLTKGTLGHTLQKGNAMTQHARGEFEVKITPLPLGGPAEEASFGRFSLEKRFRGDLAGTGQGQMLSATYKDRASGAYVAIERVTGSLAGRHGSFTFQHSGTMVPGKQHLDIKVVPDSGTGELAGISGTFVITIAGGKHSYDFEYSLPVEP